MVKKFLLLLLNIAMLIAFAACRPQQNIASDAEPEVFTNDLLCFTSVEEFNRYLQSPEKNNDIAKTNELQKYYMLKNVPDGYALYKITVGVHDIAFWYLPDTVLASADSIAAAESARENFMFVSPRMELNFSGVLSQHGLTENNLLDGKYYFDESTNPTLIWEYEDLVMMLYLPKSQAVPTDIEHLCELNEICP